MSTSTLVGKSFEHHSIDSIQKKRWIVVRENTETKYVYVECDDENNKIGQWIPAGWIEQLTLPERLRLKADSLRKSRDYFKRERDEINERLNNISINHEAVRSSLLEEMDFVREELMVAEKDIKFWRSFSIYATTSSICLFGALLLAKILFC